MKLKNLVRRKSKIQFVRQKFKKIKSASNVHRTGQPEMLFPGDERRIIDKVKNNPSTQNIAYDIGMESSENLSIKTVRKVIRKGGYIARVARKAFYYPFISEVNRRKD